ncbi:unannotated protein [freshwater metagenome]|uniref:Unannotated protein n=1 Tax=freshwater metagenome TaxID=449393 RepID=A0A6J6WA20_9ZZZZ
MSRSARGARKSSPSLYKSARSTSSLIIGAAALSVAAIMDLIDNGSSNATQASNTSNCH